nr:MAG TPA: hypothetical protein [Caudoviricetes sp.]
MLCFVKMRRCDNYIMEREKTTADILIKKKTKQQRKVIHVELKVPYQGKRHWYFGSLAAIYHILPTDVIGVKLTSLWAHFKEDDYIGRKCIIRKGVLNRTRTNRGRR